MKPVKQSPRSRWLAVGGLAVALGLVSACQSGDDAPPDAQEPPEAANVVDAPAAPPTGAVGRLQGVYVWGQDEETFAPCNTHVTYWLEGRSADLKPLQDLALHKADANNAAYQPVYVDVLVEHLGRGTDGRALSYDGVLYLRAVYGMQDKVPATCKLLPPAPPPPAVVPVLPDEPVPGAPDTPDAQELPNAHEAPAGALPPASAAHAATLAAAPAASAPLPAASAALEMRAPAGAVPASAAAVSASAPMPHRDPPHE